MDADTCPYCLQSFSEGGGRTDEHVFGEALGSRATIGACRDCNRSVGRTVEGPLHARDSLLDLLKWMTGDKPIRGQAELGHGRVAEVVVDVEGRPRLEHPTVEYQRTGDRLKGFLSFPEGTDPRVMREAIERRLRREGIPEGRARDVANQSVADAEAVSQPIEVQVTLEARLDILQRHFAKVALAASIAANVPIDSEYCDMLRQTLNSIDGGPQEAADPDLVFEVRQRLTDAGLGAPALSDGKPAAQVTLAAVPGGTLVDVHILGQPHLIGPTLIPAVIPSLGVSGIVVVREAGYPLEVRRLVD